jgi:vacuolar-type H+-ATPase subunit I/STV1
MKAIYNEVKELSLEDKEKQLPLTTIFLRLNKNISSYELYIKKLKELVDKDRAEELIDELTQNDQKRIDLIEIRQETEKLKDEVDHARRLKV